MPDAPSDIAGRLARLSQAFSLRSRREATRLSELLRVLLSSDPGLAAAAVREIDAIAHRLHGTAGTLSFTAISEAAAGVEDAIRAFDGQGIPGEADAGRALQATIEQLVSAIDRLPA
jgi:HPt (histidine-containing phosphotransfer) domain-containing protein